uniref:Cadherin domain-containing protein n=1 Tax=Periophthalmus magnuspinnatus TaxID=409849 RepID=A0A3B4BLD0_9GOBI
MSSYTLTFHLLPVPSPDNTAGIRTQRSGFNRHEQNVYLLPILVVDSGPPSLSSTGTLTIHVCGCDPEGAIQSCNATAYVMSAALSPGALIALLVCILILIGKHTLHTHNYLLMVRWPFGAILFSTT